MIQTYFSKFMWFWTYELLTEQEYRFLLTPFVMFEQCWIQWPRTGRTITGILLQTYSWNDETEFPGHMVGKSPKYGIRPTKFVLQLYHLFNFLTLGKLLNCFKPQFTLFIWKNRIIIPYFRGNIKIKIDTYLLCKSLKWGGSC